jgi:hypothetical protein
MRADTLTLKTLFQKDVRYVIPTFQRPYVWNQEDQWEPLWHDVRNTAERYLDHLEQVDGVRAKAEELAPKHFLGAVVLQQQTTSSAELETRLVIDGQQRMTTLQLLLDATQEVLEHLTLDEPARRMSRLVLNHYAEADPPCRTRPGAPRSKAFGSTASCTSTSDSLQTMSRRTLPKTRSCSAAMPWRLRWPGSGLGRW